MNGRCIASVCTGYGGLDTAVQAVMGGDLAFVADSDPNVSRLLAHRFPHVPNLGDITALDWTAVLNTYGRPHVLTGGYPCQPFSLQGKRKGTTDARHIWPHIAHALRVLRPAYGFFENVAGHLTLGFDTVLRDLASIGFDAEWCTLRADEVGAPHRRKRLFLLAVRAAAAADALDVGGDGGRPLGAGRPEPATGHLPLPDAARERHGDAGPGSGAGLPSAALGGRAAARAVHPAPRWGDYGPAIRRWEAVLGRPAPSPIDDLGRLSTPFVEWMMAVEEGHVTEVPGLSRNAQLRALGNGVVWLQAAAALDMLLARVHPAQLRSAA